ncbi:Beta-lactamase superfamily domain protein [uncultured archaeon]|nr:Beta-lactamase superfamily domain protein [uncultured archaeon]
MNVTTVNGVRITCFGHSSVGLEYGALHIYVDPFVVPQNVPPADLILHTHGHHDHCVVPEHLLKPSTSILVSPSCKHPGQTVEPGQALKAGPVTIQAVHAYNTNKPYHPRGEGVGYILTFGSGPAAVRIYLAGDTDFIPEMEQYKCDVALLPVGGTFTMNIEEAAKAVAAIKPRIVIPYHYNYMPNVRADAQAFKRLVLEASPKIDVRILIP